jgi:hypothetical protein
MRFSLLTRGLLVLGALSACAEPTGSDPADSHHDLMAPIATGMPAIAYSSEFAWSQGQPYTFMGSTDGRICFLTRVQGDFEGSSESVAVIEDSAGVWWLGGKSGQAGVGARARCITVNSYSGEYAWAHGQPAVSMGTNKQRACFLTRVSGDFEGAGESAVISSSNGGWWLDGNSAHGGVWAGARCATVQSYSAVYAWSQGQPATLAGGAILRACFFTRLAGNFEGASELVRVSRLRNANGWLLTGSSTEQGVSAKARCVT